MNEDIKALLDALKDCQRARDGYKISAEVWREKAENLQIELDKTKAKSALHNPMNGSEA